ncbi:hypothetical protein [Asticcacaulis sp. AC402]|uniref:hypothetical protein n=1 Tax=Asticcacaulis sp. AC402 TaxID=1282361 RepID=UPI0003C3E72D|nr:hypothetical protein [Asticcacaulis sp. AC402]ESQ76803.1 hypothetical protein ABAC402_03845 [Asticcacaulis sp. AC402]
MKRVWMATAAIAAAGLAGSAVATEPAYFGDIRILHQPAPSGYQPEGTTFDLEDDGKSFDIACTIAANGRLSACEAGENELYDEKFIDIALANVSQWIVAPQTVGGQSTAGRPLIVTVRFNRSDGNETADVVAVASTR